MKRNVWRLFKTTMGNHDGFTLLETLIGLLIFTIGIVPVLYMQTVAVKEHADSRANVSMIQGAATQVETIGPSLRYDDEEIEELGGNATYDYSSMPVGMSDEHKRELINYTVRQNELVRGLKMIYVTNKLTVDAKKTYTIGQPILNTKDFLDR